VRTRDAILESWYRRTIGRYRPEVQQQLRSCEDQLRNLVGYQLRSSLAILVEELEGDMDAARIAPALDDIIRIPAVQDLSAPEAIGGIFFAKEASVKNSDEGDVSDFNRRVAQLALMAFDVYTACRQQIFAMRTREASGAAAFMRWHQ